MFEKPTETDVVRGGDELSGRFDLDDICMVVFGAARATPLPKPTRFQRHPNTHLRRNKRFSGPPRAPTWTSVPQEGENGATKNRNKMQKYDEVKIAEKDGSEMRLDAVKSESIYGQGYRGCEPRFQGDTSLQYVQAQPRCS